MELREKVCVDKMGSRALREKVCVDKMGSRAWREKVCVDKMGSGAVQHNNNRPRQSRFRAILVFRGVVVGVAKANESGVVEFAIKSLHSKNQVQRSCETKFVY